MRLCSCLAGLAVLATPLQAAEPPLPAWDGVWQGRIGDLPVRACLQQGGGDWKSGSYYYLSQMKPIRLEHSADGSWQEQSGQSGKSTGTWRVSVQDGRLTGEWSDGAKRLPIALQRVAQGRSEDRLTCANPAYIAPRLRPLEETRKAATINGIAVTAIEYRVPRWFSDVSMTSFALRPTEPGDLAINARLALRAEGGTGEGDYADCMQGELGSLGVDGYYSFRFEPEELGKSYLRVGASSDSSCGGAHPNTENWWLSFDRKSGKEIALWRWFTAKAAPRDYVSYGGPSLQVSPELRQAIVRHFTFEDPECRESFETTDFWYAGLGRRGILFRPSLPRVIMACTDDAMVPYADLAPFLSPEGRSELVRLGLNRR